MRSWSISVGRLFNVDVRIHLTFLILPMFIYWTDYAAHQGAVYGSRDMALVGIILLAVADPLSAFMADFFRVLPLQFGSLTRDLVTLVMGAGVGLGILGSWLSVRTYLIR
jgi:hypothetical protein